MGNAGKPGSLLGVDGRKVLFMLKWKVLEECNLNSVVCKNRTLRVLLLLGHGMLKTPVSFSNEQYNVQLIDSLRPTIYKAMLFLKSLNSISSYSR